MQIYRSAPPPPDSFLPHISDLIDAEAERTDPKSISSLTSPAQGVGIFVVA